MQGHFLKHRDPAATAESFCTSPWNHRIACSGVSVMYISHFAYIQTREQEIFGNRFPARKHLHLRPNDGSKPEIGNGVRI
jgi:hypothetical protein